MKLDKKSILFAPSLMCMDYLNVGSQLDILNQNFDILHVDIMDGHFCKSIHLSPSFIKSIRNATNLPIEVHLMVEHPGDFITDLVECGADIITLHFESITHDAFRLISQIKSYGKQVGLALCPATPISCVKYLLNQIDILTILNVDVGYVGQPLIIEMLEKVAKARKIRTEEGYHYLIQSDGGVNISTYSDLLNAGTEIFVLGHAALFGKHPELACACKIMKKDFNLPENEFGG